MRDMSERLTQKRPDDTLTASALVLICMIGLIFLKLRKKPEAANGVNHFPIPVPQFITGLYSLYLVQRDGLSMIERYVQKYGKFFKVPIGFTDVYLVADPVIANKILKSHDPAVLNKPKQFYDEFLLDLLREGLISLDFEMWKPHRGVLAHSFLFHNLSKYLDSMNKHSQQLALELLAECSKHSENAVQGKSVQRIVCWATIKIIAESVFGNKCATDEETALMHDGIMRGKQIVTHRFLNPHLLIPPVWWMHRASVELNEIMEKLTDLLYKVISRSRTQRTYSGGITDKKNTKVITESDSENRKDSSANFECLLENMISHGASDREISAEVATFSVVGHETTATALQMVMFHLACNPEAQILCQEEISKLRDSKQLNGTGESLSMSDLMQLKYLEMCILESLRITPIVPVIMRRLDSTFSVDENRSFNSGDLIMIVPWAIHRDPEFYPNPEKFDPNRFLAENVRSRQPSTFLPFSTGPRNCIGYKYAILEMKVILAYILHKFNLSTTNDPASIKYFSEITLATDTDINIILKKR